MIRGLKHEMPTLIPFLIHKYVYVLVDLWPWMRQESVKNGWKMERGGKSKLDLNRITSKFPSKIHKLNFPIHKNHMKNLFPIKPSPASLHLLALIPTHFFMHLNTLFLIQLSLSIICSLFCVTIRFFASLYDGVGWWMGKTFNGDQWSEIFGWKIVKIDLKFI